MSWIKTIAYEDADPRLKRIYDRVKGPNQNIDNVLAIHSLRPHTLIGHMTLYKSVLHNKNNILPKWYLEALGIYVSYLNKCSYCVDHHLMGLKRLLQDDTKTQQFINAVKNDTLKEFLDPKSVHGMEYARALTLNIDTISELTVNGLKASGITEGELLEINQVVSYFNYVNRTVLGLGVTTKGDILGLSPNSSDEPSNWSHQ